MNWKTWLPENLDLQPLLQKTLTYIPNLIAVLALLVGVWVANKLIGRMLRGSLQKTNIPQEMQSLLLRITRYSVSIVGLMMVVDQLGFNITALLAGAGVAGLAVSFAAQDTIANIISGVAIIIDRPFKKGDWIALGDLHAVVDDIRLRTTVLNTFDNESLVVPNKQLAQERIVNYTLTPRIRSRVDIGIAYKEDIEAARKVMLGTLQDDPKILSDPAPDVVVMGLGASSVDLQMRFWIENPRDKVVMAWKYTERCKQALDAAGIEIPFPHMQLFMERSEGLEYLASQRNNHSAA